LLNILFLFILFYFVCRCVLLNILTFMLVTVDQDLKSKLTVISEVDLWQNYICEMRRPDTWPDNMLLMCAAWFIGRDIIVISQDRDGHPISAKYHPKRTVNPGPELFLGHIKNTHYQSLVPIRTVLHNVTCSRCRRNAKSLRMHLSRNPICRSSYDIEHLQALAETLKIYERRQKNREQSRHHSKRRRETREQDRRERQETVRRKQIQFYNDHKEEIRRKRIKYYRENREVILQKRLQYYKNHQDEILQKRAVHYHKCREQILQKKAKKTTKRKSNRRMTDVARDNKKRLPETSQV